MYKPKHLANADSAKVGLQEVGKEGEQPSFPSLEGNLGSAINAASDSSADSSSNAASASVQEQENPKDPGEEVNAATKRQVGRSAAMMSVLVIVSRVTGFLRTWGQAYALGVTMLASVYTVANNLPNQLYELVAGGMIMTAFLPTYLSVKKRLGRKGANDYASNLFWIVTIAMGLLTVLSFIFAGFVIWTQSFSASADFDSNLAVYFFRFFAIEIVLYALSSIISGILNAERDYFWSNAAPIFNNVICTSSFLLYAFFAKSNPGLAILLLAIGNPLGVLVQVLLQIPSLHRHGVSLRPHVDLHDPALKDMLSIGLPTLIVTIASFPTVAVQTSSALQVTSSGASVAYYSRLWYMLPYSVFAVPLTVALFTELSQYSAENDMDSFKDSLIFGVKRILFMLIPFAMYLIVFSVPLITVLAAGKFDHDDILTTAMYLSWLSTALPAYGLSTLLQKVCSSLRRMKAYAIATIVAAIVQVAFCMTLTGVFGLAGVAFSSTLFFIAVDVVTLLNLRSRLGHIGLASAVASAVRSIALGLAGAIVGAILLRLYMGYVGQDLGIVQSIIACVVGGVPAVLVTYGGAVLLHVPEASAVTSLLHRH